VLALSRKRPLISAEASFQEIEIAFNRGSGDMLRISRFPWRFAWLGAGFAGAEVAAEAGLQPFDEGVVAEGAAGAPVAGAVHGLTSGPSSRPSLSAMR
jgi:hypothetical protein